MRSEQLLYLCETAKMGSMRAAAEKLHITHQGLHSSLKALEKELDYPLFVSSRRGILLTPEGEIVVKHANEILNTIEKMKASIDEKHSGQEEYLSICTGPVVTEFFFKTIFHQLSSKYPYLCINLEEFSSMQCVEAIKDKKQELSIIGIQNELLDELGYSDIFSPNLSFYPLFSYNMYVAVSEYHPLAQYSDLTIENVIQYPFVFPGINPITEDLNYLWLESIGTPNVKYNTSNSSIYNEIIRNGSAIGFYPYIVHPDFPSPSLPGAKFIPIKGKGANHTIGYLYNNEHPLTHAMSLVINELEVYYSKYC